jgi:hypothetical protein
LEKTILTVSISDFSGELSMLKMDSAEKEKKANCGWVYIHR